MTDLIKQAEALEVKARVAAMNAFENTADAERWRAEAALLREQAAREPRGGWVALLGDKASSACGLAGGYLYKTEEAARNAIGWSNGHVYRVVEVRPVRITPENLQQAYRRYHGINGNMRAVMEYALSLAGVEVEE